ncbi:MAG: CYTH domain-containing protein [Lachnospiraceae bacterium]|jgi:CYTH domain-containing protein|nr:CYTH domain-containing protein [Lachnospiraceae bacterium]
MEHNATGLEIERKFTLNWIPDNLDEYKCIDIEQAYLCTAPVVRIRREDDEYYLTYKGSGLRSRTEYNLPLDEESYNHLKGKADGNIITKKRYIIPLDSLDFSQREPDPDGADETPKPNPYVGLIAEFDVFDPPFDDLMIAEVEFPDIETADRFNPPEWFDEDVTMKYEYHNSYLSKKKII